MTVTFGKTINPDNLAKIAGLDITDEKSGQKSVTSPKIEGRKLGKKHQPLIDKYIKTEEKIARIQGDVYQGGGLYTPVKYGTTEELTEAQQGYRAVYEGLLDGKYRLPEIDIGLLGKTSVGSKIKNGIQNVFLSKEANKKIKKKRRLTRFHRVEETLQRRAGLGNPDAGEPAIPYDELTQDQKKYRHLCMDLYNGKYQWFDPSVGVSEAWRPTEYDVMLRRGDGFELEPKKNARVIRNLTRVETMEDRQPWEMLPSTTLLFQTPGEKGRSGSWYVEDLGDFIPGVFGQQKNVVMAP